MPIAVFIDGAYVDSVMRREFPGCKIDIQKLVLRICGERELLRAYYCDSPPWQGTPPSDDDRRRASHKDRYFAALRRLPRFEVRLGKCERRTNTAGSVTFEQKRVDILMAVDLVLLAVKGRISHAALITGDSDLLPAIEVARNEGVLVHLFHGEVYHDELWDACDERTRLDRAFVDSVLRDE